MIIQFDGGQRLEIPEGMDLMEWARGYFKTSNMRGLSDYYARLERRYAMMALPTTSRAFQRLKNETLAEDERGAFNMALRISGTVVGHYLRLYKRYTKMGLYHQANHYRELAKDANKYDPYLAYNPIYNSGYCFNPS